MIKRNTFLSIGALCALMLTPVQGRLLFVTDTDAGTVSAVDAAGTVTQLVTGLTNPNGIIEQGGVLYVATNGEIRRYTTDGDPLTAFATFTGVSSIAMDLLGNVLAVGHTLGVGELRKYDSSGTLLATATGLDTPTALAVNDAGEVSVAHGNEIDGFEIRHYSSSLGSSTAWTHAILNNPLGLLFSGTELLVSALYDGKVERFDGAGTHLGTLVNSNVDFPWGLAFNPDTGDLVVASSLGGTIQRFDSSGAHLNELASGFTTPAGLAFSTVPEPGTYAMIGSALIALSLLGRRKR